LKLSPEKRAAMLLELRARRIRREGRRKLWSFYPDEGPLRRELYPKHLQFFAGGATHRERLMMAANRVGKTEGIGGYEATLHLTGHYPPWWRGRRFDRAISAWASGKTNETTRDIVQAKMFGKVEGSGPGKRFAGSGMVPGDDIGDVAWRSGFPDLADKVAIRHVSGGWSTLGIKSYQQGRGSFEGTEQDLIWLDEEPPLDIYTECLIRTMTTDGLVIVTFTPLEGMSETVMSFLEGGKLPDDLEQFTQEAA
jgi:phage terminase large subunit-like protein